MLIVWTAVLCFLAAGPSLICGQKSLNDNAPLLQDIIANLQIDRMLLEPLLVARVPGTAGHQRVHDFIHSHFKGLGWRVWDDRFLAKRTPIGHVEFSNVIAKWSPHGSLRKSKSLVLACHYDSKLFQGQEFIGATDSSVPCAILLQLADLISNDFSDLTLRPDISFQFIFFDGEEAFVNWSDQDSLYGARHLSQLFALTPSHYGLTTFSTFRLPHLLSTAETYANSVELFLLLDLIGSSEPWPQYHDYYSQTSLIYSMLGNIETRLLRLGMLSDTRKKMKRYFLTRGSDELIQSHQLPFIDDDHKPFLLLGVPVLHVIPYPFPRVWHTLGDSPDVLDYDTIDDLLRIMALFLVEYCYIV